MSLDAILTDARNSNQAKVTSSGQLVVSAADYSKPSVQVMAVNDQVYNFIEPRPSARIIITDIILNADKDVGVGDSTVQIYANTIGPDDSTQSEVLLNVDLAKNQTLVLNGMNLSPESTGVWVNGEMNDNNVKASIYYYYLEPL